MNSVKLDERLCFSFIYTFIKLKFITNTDNFHMISEWTSSISICNPYRNNEFISTSLTDPFEATKKVTDPWSRPRSRRSLFSNHSWRCRTTIIWCQLVTPSPSHWRKSFLYSTMTSYDSAATLYISTATFYRSAATFPGPSAISISLAVTSPFLAVYFLGSTVISYDSTVTFSGSAATSFGMAATFLGLAVIFY